MTPLVEVISSDMTYFNGFGKHTAADVLHDIGVLPHIPAGVVADDDNLYARLRQGIVSYTEDFKNPKFLLKCAGDSNAANPFAFHQKADDHYISSYVRVYRRQSVRMPKALYDFYASNGLFDPEHTIGLAYHGDVVLADRTFKYVPVWAYYYNGEGNSSRVAYTVIQAQPPKEWGLERWVKTQVKEDVRAAGRQTTLGPAQFQQFNANMTDDKQKNKSGRRPTLHTNRPGRPCKPKTVAQRQQIAKRGAKARYHKPPSVIMNTDIMPRSTPEAEGEGCTTVRITRARATPAGQQVPEPPRKRLRVV
ncbi:hypothetical protein BDW22DRAFT_1488608 [Trametopsis cervina]|nr:hypothetical protein BDW22DRAFT_1488608 [Trametopsis cervina]